MKFEERQNIFFVKSGVLLDGIIEEVVYNESSDEYRYTIITPDHVYYNQPSDTLFISLDEAIDQFKELL